MKHILKPIVLALCLMVSALARADEPLHLLGIGNSFTENMLHHLPYLLPDQGRGVLDVAYLYRGGATLDQYCQMMADRERRCSLFEFDGETGAWRETKGVLIDSVLMLKRWDVVTLQQASGISGHYETIKPNLETMLDTVEHYQPEALVAWHATWSYSRNSKHTNFTNYGNSQLQMDYAIERTTVALKRDFSDRIDMIIPSQPLLKRLRQTALNDSLDLTADGYHLAPFAAEAVSYLVYEMLLAPRLGVPVTDIEREGIGDTIHTAEDFKLAKQLAYEVSHDTLLWEHEPDDIVYRTDYYAPSGHRLQQPARMAPTIRCSHYLSGERKDERIILLDK